MYTITIFRGDDAIAEYEGTGENRSDRLREIAARMALDNHPDATHAEVDQYGDVMIVEPVAQVAVAGSEPDGEGA